MSDIDTIASLVDARDAEADEADPQTEQGDETDVEDQESEADESSGDEGAEQSDSDDADDAETVLVLTVDNRELEIPADTPKQVIETIQNLERSLKQDYQAKTTQLAEQRRQQDEVISQARAQALDAARSDIQKAQAQVNALAQIAYTPEDALFDLQDDPAAYKRAVKTNRAIEQQFQALNAHFAEVDRQLQTTKAEQSKAKATRALSRLAEIGLDQGAIQKVFQDAAKEYGLSNEYIEGVLDAETVEMMADAVKWRKQKQTAPQIRKKVSQVTKAPQPKAPARQRDALGRFKDKNLSTDDLASILNSMR